jgi:hypothetical protein
MTLLRTGGGVAGVLFGADEDWRFFGRPFDPQSQLPFPATAARGRPGRCPRAH